MTSHHYPIVPPLELKYQWVTEVCPEHGKGVHLIEEHVADRSAEWAADQEFEGCCEAIKEVWDNSDASTLDEFLREFRSIRRPKPPSLREEALKELHYIVERLPEGTLFSDAAILLAIESLPS